MYSIIVSGLVEDVFKPKIEIDRSRFLEYTSSSIKDQLGNLSTESIHCLKSWPCILMQEGRGDEVVHVVQINTINANARSISFVVSKFDPNISLVNDAIWKLRHDLDIADFEFSRNHWAVKDCDLFSILHSADYAFTDTAISRFKNIPLPTPSRQKLLQSRNEIGDWGHTEIDDFLLEAGVEGLDAGRSIGSRRDRANAIIKFALDNPQAVTAENSLFQAFIVRNALQDVRAVLKMQPNPRFENVCS